MYILYSQHLWSYDNSIVNSRTTCAMKQTPCLKTNNQTRKQNQTLNLISMNVGFHLRKFSYGSPIFSTQVLTVLTKLIRTNETETQSIKRAQWLKALAANCDNLSYILQAHMVEGKNQLTYDVLWLPAVSHGMHLYPTHKINNQMLDKSGNSALASDFKVFSFVTWN